MKVRPAYATGGGVQFIVSPDGEQDEVFCHLFEQQIRVGGVAWVHGWGSRSGADGIHHTGFNFGTAGRLKSPRTWFQKWCYRRAYGI